VNVRRGCHTHAFRKQVLRINLQASDGSGSFLLTPDLDWLTPGTMSPKKLSVRVRFFLFCTQNRVKEIRGGRSRLTMSAFMTMQPCVFGCMAMKKALS
jgi:hypothetical protein